MIPYIGDISKNDAEVLKEMAETHDNILEFGVGASTQVLSAYSKNSIIAVDTSVEWLEKTKRNIELLEIKNVPSFVFWEQGIMFTKFFDFVFDDCADEYRKDFALKIWPQVNIGGILAFHDTRRWQDARNVCHVLEQIYESVDRVIWNYNHSNITLVYKKEHEPYENWQETENRMPWQIGWGDPDVEYVKKQLHG